MLQPGHCLIGVLVLSGYWGASCRKPLPPRQILELDSREHGSDSEIAVFDDGAVRIRRLTEPLSPGAHPEVVPDARWGYRWANSEEKLFQATLGARDLEQLKTLLERGDIKRLDGYANAGPSVGDFKIAIDRAQGPQKLEVFGFQPAYHWVQNPPLVDLICATKIAAQLADKAERVPAWCETRSGK